MQEVQTLKSFASVDINAALRAGVERVFGDQVEVQRCQIHKRRNVKGYLPENCQKDYDRRMRNAYAMNNYAEARIEEPTLLCNQVAHYEALGQFDSSSRALDHQRWTAQPYRRRLV